MDKFAGMDAPIRLSIGSETLQRLIYLSERTEKTRDRTQDKLTPIMNAPAPTTNRLEPSKDLEYPPYFAEIRAALNRIDIALDGIEDALNRTEI